MMLLSSMTVMPKIGKSIFFSTILITLLAVIATTSQPVAALEYTLENHTFELGARARLARVDAEENARAASLLIRLRATSEWSQQFSTLFELDSVALGWQDEFSNGEHFNGHPVIPDVAGTDLNQALLRYSPTNTLQLTLGREALNLGNQRFVGTNGFWQNEQTLDTAGFKLEFGSASNVMYRYVDNANRINGQDAGKKLSPTDSNYAANNGIRPPQFLGDHDHNTHLVFAHFKEWDLSQIDAYYFDMEIKDAKALSNQTLGLRYEYKGRWNTLRTLAHAELALQERTDIHNDALLQYYDLGGGVGFGSNEITLNIQRLGEKNGVSFVTPLASLHDHNGWADKFLLTPSTGLRDYSLQYIWRQNPIKIDARYHRFNTDTDNSRIGEEFDIDLAYKFNRENIVLLRFADFTTSDDSYADEQRVFLMFTHNL
ncbi:hypothetical protein [Thalassolituus oleivorans]|uniref:hypothetical protein n=1 Tax=Thalassolituus oleivorans TaxID=187493 RepID=UPI0023F3BA10|nr:hypothetical protein [Thalassolituus oleivorans]